MKEDYACRLIKELIVHYKKEMDSVDSTERIIYSIVIEDLRGLISDLVHH